MKVKKIVIAKLLGVHRNTVSHWLRAGKLKSTEIEDVVELVCKIERQKICNELYESIASVLRRSKDNGKEEESEDESI